jgi:glycerate kinase
VADAIARGVRRAMPEAKVELIPMADGGEGTVEALVAATGGRLTCTGPLGEPVSAQWGRLGDGGSTAVIEMAAASGLALVPPERRNPMLTSTQGTGELILAALDDGADEILVGIGGSATNDGGVGAAQAAGVIFTAANGRPCPVPTTGGMLDQVTAINLAGRDSRIAHATIRVACDVDNPLCGPRGAAAVYGPQKGATPEQVAALDANLAHLAELIERDLGEDVRDLPGAGGAGGLGAGLIAFFDATLQPGVEMVMDAVGFAERIAGADLIITGEGRLDRQSMMGKVIEGVGRAGRAAGVPVVALAGIIGQGAEATAEVLESYHAINPPDTPLAEALAQTAPRLEATARELVLRHFRCA